MTDDGIPLPVYYVIRHRVTRMHIPHPAGRSGRGGTWVELARFPWPPRLFNTRGPPSAP